MGDVAVVILNWNGAGLLKKFLPPLIDAVDPSLAEVWVADNGSTDHSLDLISEDFPQVRCIALGFNYGFAEGYNRALEQIDANYFVLLNSDVEVTYGWLEPLYRMISENPGVGACMPKIRSWYHREIFEHAGAAGGFLDRFGYPFCRGRIFNRLEADSGQFDTDSNVFWASGACLMIRAGLYRESGGLDPFFFAHMEEIDLCWRIKNMGYTIRYCHESVVYHMGGATLPKDDHKKTYLNFRNNLILLYKNLPSGKLLPVLGPRILLDFLSIFQFLFRLEFRNLTAVLHAHFYLLVHFPSLRRLRRQNLAVSRPSMHPEMYPGSIVFDFFVLGKRKFNDLGFHAIRQL